MNHLYLLSAFLCLVKTNAFVPNHKGFLPKTKIFAQGGPPQYEKLDGVLREAEIVANESVMLHVDTSSSLEYKPGHVMALEIENTLSTLNEKTKEDAARNDGWLRGPYTVSRATENSFDILIKVVGDKSKLFASSAPGTKLKFGGKFKVPILEGIEKETTKRAVFISTGVGVGPFVGAIEDALAEKDFPPIELYACYRTKEDIVYADYLNEMVEQNPGKLMWKPIISSETGRVSTAENVKTVCASTNDSCINDTHFHLIGNGQMVKEWKDGLAKAGVPDEKVTIEMYFNGKAEADEDAVNNIASVMLETLKPLDAALA